MLKEKLEAFPRVKLSWGTTPIVYVKNLSEDMGINLYIKRDDLTGLALGGNKTRKLEFIMGEALKRGCDTVITAGAVHSNHALQTAAAAKKLGMDAVLVLRGIKENKGNFFMDKLLGADTRVFPVKTGKELKPHIEAVEKELISKGKKPMVIPVGGSNAIGAFGYIAAAVEVAEQCKESGLCFDYVVTATSSGGTQAGTLMGFKLVEPDIKVRNIGVGDPREELIDDVYELVQETSQMLGLDDVIMDKGEIEAATIDGYGFGGYGTVVREVLDLIVRVAVKEGIYLDPVYTGKGFYGLVDMVEGGAIPSGSKVLFIHTGGIGGLFQYEEVVSQILGL